MIKVSKKSVNSHVVHYLMQHRPLVVMGAVAGLSPLIFSTFCRHDSKLGRFFFILQVMLKTHFKTHVKLGFFLFFSNL